MNVEEVVASPVLLRSKRRRVARRCLLASTLLAIAYLCLPIIAGSCAIGDRRGPCIYPESLHELLYMVGWEIAGREGKPRILGRGGPARPWFYACG